MIMTLSYQIAHLRRLYGLTLAQARLIATLHYGEDAA